MRVYNIANPNVIQFLQYYWEVEPIFTAKCTVPQLACNLYEPAVCLLPSLMA